MRHARSVQGNPFILALLFFDGFPAFKELLFSAQIDFEENEIGSGIFLSFKKKALRAERPQNFSIQRLTLDIHTMVG